MRSTLSTACFAGVVFVAVAGCSGGGGGESGGGMVRPSASESPVPAAVARQAGRLSAPTFTAAQLEAHERSILARADTFLLSDWLYVNPDPQAEDDLFYPQTVRCVGDTCYRATADGTGGIEAITIQSLATAANQPESGHRVHPTGQRSGVRLAATTDVENSFNSASYGGWLDYSAFGVEGIEFIGGELDEWGLLYSYSYGEAPETNPAVGTATWTGIVAGVDVSLSETAGNTIQGQARIDFDIGNRFQLPNVDIAFTQMYDLDAATRRSDIQWHGVRVQGGSFSTTQLVSGRISGRFYGPNHEEVGGVFESRGDPGYSFNILGAFGAARE